MESILNVARQRRPTVLSVAFVLLVFAPRSAFADFAAICEPSRFKGAVKRVVLSEAVADPESGVALRALQIRSVADVTRDGRTVTELETHLEEPPPDVIARSFTTIRQYDVAGRLMREAVKSDSVNTVVTTSCEYDDEARLTRATVESTNPMLRRTLTYRYGPSWRSELLVTRAVSILTTVTLDVTGRPLLQTRFDQLEGAQISLTDYRYLPEGVDECTHELEGPRRCRFSILDAQGNEIEARSVAASTRVRYEYDGAGNWTRRITSTTGQPARGEWRKITYW